MFMFWNNNCKAKYYKPKQKKRMEFSKLIYTINLILVAIVTGMSFLCVIMSGFWGITDLSPITVICTSAFAELATFSVVYARKAQAENVLKISQQIQKSNIDINTIETANQIVNSNFSNSM